MTPTMKCRSGISLSRALCLVLIVLLLVAAPVSAKQDNAKPDKTPPGQGVVETGTPVPTTEPTPVPTTEPTPAATAEPTPSPSATVTATATPAVNESSDGAGTTESGDATDGSAAGEDEGTDPLLVLVPAAALLAGGAVIATRRRSPDEKDAGTAETETPAGGGGAASVATVVHKADAPLSSPPQDMSGFPAPLASKYRDITYLGQGGIARVYRAVRSSDGTMVAVKCPLVPDEETGTHFMREIRFWERLHHPNILAIYAANILPVPYVEMEYAPKSLKDCPLPLSPEQALRVIRGVAAGLAFAHENGVIHRDIKPENILCAADGTPKITDWGLGSVTDGGHRTQVGGFSPGYAAPEQLRPSVHGAEDARTDLYQLGVLFFELLTGTLPFSGEGMGEVTLAILGEPAPLPSASGAPTDVYDAVILRCLEKEKDQRFSSVADFCDALRETAGDASHPTDG